MPDWLDTTPGAGGFVSVTRTLRELSIVAPAHLVPADAPSQRPFAILEVEGPLPFDAIGVLASLTLPLARADISLLAIATYDTDYLLVREQDLDRALSALRAEGHQIADTSR